MPLGEKAMLRRVFGSKLEMTTAKDSAGIQVTDVILWLFNRNARGENLPDGCQAILNYVLRRGAQDDFTFETVHASVEAEVNKLNTDEPDQKTMARAWELYQIGEDNRKKAVEDYERLKTTEQ
jgi:hypothetical protein